MPKDPSANPASAPNPNDAITPAFVEALTDESLERLILLAGIQRVSDLVEYLMEQAEYEDGADDEDDEDDEDATWLDDEDDD